MIKTYLIRARSSSSLVAGMSGACATVAKPEVAPTDAGEVATVSSGAAAARASKEGSKTFFFEKKNQKTFGWWESRDIPGV